MKFYHFIIAALCSLCMISCEDYLYKTLDAEIDDAQVFGTYEDFQGYVDNLYYTLIDYLSKDASSMDVGDDVVSVFTSHLATSFIRGSYNSAWGTGIFASYSSSSNVSYETQTIWEGWNRIRAANLGLENLGLLSDATQEERDALEGQMLFFRAYAHFEMARAWGGLPYIDHYLTPDSNMNIPRLTLEETFLRIAADFEAAKALLPEDWDPGLVGVERINQGRITKAMATGMYARTMLYVASPWVVGLQTLNPDQTDYNEEYCKLAAEAALEVINSGYYSLAKWEDYQENFATNNSAEFDIPWTTETMIQSTQINRTGDLGRSKIGRLYMPLRFGQVNCMSPTLEFIDMYETQNGLEQDDDATFNADGVSPWSNLDPRFRATIAVDRMKWVKKSVDNNTFQLYSSGDETSANGAGLDMRPTDAGSITGYIIRKFSCYGANNDDSYTEYRICCPQMRLSEMYLIYAEAVNEVYGPNGSLPGSSMTAVEAINILRRRVMLPENEDMTLPMELETFSQTCMPDLDSRYTTDTETFRDKIRKERTIELAFEGHRWHDTRRWLIAHKLPMVATGLEFNKNHTSFNEVVIEERIFEFPKHYLLPFKSADVYVYAGFVQNPGWETK